jgi:nucleotide-binding universal stress UspA family protein
MDAVSMMAGVTNNSMETAAELAQAGRELHAWARQYGSGAVPLHVHLEHGPAADTILRVAQEGGYDLVVMGTHGRTGIARLVLGSVAQRVASASVCPVLTVHGKDEEVQPAE